MTTARRARPRPAVARPEPTGPEQTGLWGQPQPVTTPARTRSATNDLDLVASVIRHAAEPGYVLVGPAERVYRREPGTKHDVTAAPTYEADTVAQLLASGHLKIGGSHSVRIGRTDGPARSVLVTATARSMVSRWAALHPLR